MPSRSDSLNAVKTGLSLTAFGIGGVIWLIVALRTLALTHGPVATATVSASSVRIGHKSGDTTEITLSFSDSAGRPEVARVNVSGTPARRIVGTHVSIHYDPQSPGRAVIIGLEPSLAMPVVFFALMALAVFAALYARVRRQTFVDLPPRLLFPLRATLGVLAAVFLVLIAKQTWPHDFTLPVAR